MEEARCIIPKMASAASADAGIGIGGREEGDTLATPTPQTDEGTDGVSPALPPPFSPETPPESGSGNVPVDNGDCSYSDPGVLGPNTSCAGSTTRTFSAAASALAVGEAPAAAAPKAALVVQTSALSVTPAGATGVITADGIRLGMNANPGGVMNVKTANANDDADPVGDALLQILNDPRKGNPFRYPGTCTASPSDAGSSTAGSVHPANGNSEPDGADDLRAFRPILSSYNLHLVRGLARQFFSFVSGLIWDDTVDGGNDRIARTKAGGRNKSWAALRQTLQSTAVLLVASTVLLAGPTTVVVLFSLRAILLILAFCASLLVDFHELTKIIREASPDWLVAIAGALVSAIGTLAISIWHIVDGHLFLGRAYAGRDGEARPLTDDRSSGTQDHYRALSFCSVMVSESEVVRLRERSKRLEERERKKRSKSLKNAKKKSSTKPSTTNSANGGSESLASNTSSADGRLKSKRIRFKKKKKLRSPTSNVEILDGKMPGGDELLERLINDDDQEAHSECFGQTPADEAIEVVSAPLRNRRSIVSASSYDLMSNPDLEELLSADADDRYRPLSSDGCSEGDEYNMLSSDASVDSDIGSDTSISYADGSSVGASSISTTSIPGAISNSVILPRHSSKKERELNWFDVGTKVGIRLLNSEKVQKLMKEPNKADLRSDVGGALSPADRDVIGLGSGDPDEFEYAAPTDVTTRSSIGELLNRTLPPLPTTEPTQPKHALWSSPGATLTHNPSFGSLAEIESDSVDVPAHDGEESLGLDVAHSHSEGDEVMTPSSFDAPNADDVLQSSSSSCVAPSFMSAEDGLEQNVDRNLPLDSTAIFRKSLQSVRKRNKMSSKAHHVPPSRRNPLLPGMKIVVPMIPLQPQKQSSQHRHKGFSSRSSHYQMATVIASERIYVGEPALDQCVTLTKSTDDNADHVESELKAIADISNCVSITCLIDRSYLRNGKFATMNLRVMDTWKGEKYMPRHSEYPIGACVATSFGVGVLVGWRVEDDIHIVQSLWQKRGAGSAIAYLNREALKGLVPGGVGYKVTTTSGKGQVVAYTKCGPDFLRGTFAVKLKPRDRHSSQMLHLSPDDILSCKSAQFMPIIEIIRSSTQYQIQVELYELALRQRYHLENADGLHDGQDAWSVVENGVEMAMSCFMKAISEDQEFDEGVNEFLSSVINFLEELDFGADRDCNNNQISSPRKGREIDQDNDAHSTIFTALSDQAGPIGQEVSSEVPEAVTASESGSDVGSPFWDMFGGLFQKKDDEPSTVRSDSTISSSTTALSAVESEAIAIEQRTSMIYRKIYAFLKTTMRSVAIARTYVADEPNLQIGLQIVYEFLLFIRTIIKVQQANSSTEAIQAWKATVKDFKSIFGPMQERMAQLALKISRRLERHGKKAKIRLLRFIDIILADEQFLQGLELLEWVQCLDRIEHAVVKAKVVDSETCSQYHKAGVLLFETLAPRAQNQGDAAQRNEEKIAYFARLLKLVASPHRSLLKFLMRDDTLELIERLFVRVFQKNQEAALMLSIYASNATTLRHLRMLKNMPVSGKLWGPLLDASVEEFVTIVNAMPPESKTFVEPISRLFTIGVANLQVIRTGDIVAGGGAHWLDFLAEEDAVEIIQELDSKLRNSLDRFCSDVKTVMEFLPYYSTIDEDILQLIDELSIKRFLKEAADALLDADRFPVFLKEKLTFMIARFLDYLPKISIPIERREIGEGWVLTCRDKDGQDLRLSDVQVEQENLVCEVLGGDNILSPMFELKKQKKNATESSAAVIATEIATRVGGDDNEGEGEAQLEYEEGLDGESDEEERISVLNDIAELIRNAQLHGCWEAGRGGVKDRKQCIDPALRGLPVSEVLKCGIELWQNLEMDDDELMQLAIRDVTYQIKLQEEMKEGKSTSWEMRDESNFMSSSFIQESPSDLSASFVNNHIEGTDDEKEAWKYNPRKDPTLLYIELLNMSFTLNEFLFRVEPAERSTIFDPVFEGYGNLIIKNVSIKLRLECRKERIQRLDTEVFVPVLQVATLEVALEKIKFKFKSTGADWLLNGLVKGFREVISDVVESKTKESIVQQIEETILKCNAYLADNPDLLLNVLGIEIDDLEENIVYL